MRPVLASLLAIVGALALVACAPTPDLPPPPPLEAGALASPEPHATRVGLDTLRRGGNAVDAAVSTHFALAVTFPYAGNIGGGGFALVHEPGATTSALDFREMAPAAAHPDLFLDEAGEVIRGLSLNSHLSVGVPGSVAGMYALHERYGSLPWREVVMPAVHLAREGFVLDEWTARSFAEKADKLDKLEGRLAEATDFAGTFFGDEGELFQQPELAEALERIANDGPAEFYHGATADLLIVEMEAGGGLITREDLAAYEPVWREPIEGDFRGNTVFSMPPPSSGGIALLQLLELFERAEEPAWHSLEHLHLVAEIEKRVYADRARHLGDPDFYEVPIDRLLEPSYLDARFAEVDLEGKSDPALVTEGLGAPAESLETLHFSVIDAEGMAVSVTTTINAAYGSGIVVDGAGFLLNNEMDDFSAKPGVPNLYGVTGGEANKVEASKRMLSSMTPTIVLDEQEDVRLVLGSPGGSTIITSVFQVVVNRLVYGLSLDEAVGAPRFHHQWPQLKRGEDPVYVEEVGPFRLDAGLLEALEARGYTVNDERFNKLGNVQAVEVDGQSVHAVADPRGIGLGGTQPSR